MNCRDCAHLIERDDGLTPGEHAAREQHLAGCPGCREARARLTSVLGELRRAATHVPLPDVNEEWRTLRAKLSAAQARPARSHPLAPVIWLGAPLAAAAALVFAFVGQQSPPAPLTAAEPGVARADFVEAGDANASTMIYVDRESGWLVVWAASDSGKG